MLIRRTAEEDLPAVAGLYEMARAALKARGVDQWQDGYPNGVSAREDMLRGTGYVLEDRGRVIATACLAFGREPTYERIVNGSWACDPEEYGFLHRIAVDPEAKGRGAAGLLFSELKRQAEERGVTAVRGDTHRDNLPMQRVMAKNGLHLRGVIYLENGDERLAYETLWNDVEKRWE